MIRADETTPLDIEGFLDERQLDEETRMVARLFLKGWDQGLCLHIFKDASASVEWVETQSRSLVILMDIRLRDRGTHYVTGDSVSLTELSIRHNVVSFGRRSGNAVMAQMIPMVAKHDDYPPKTAHNVQSMARAEGMRAEDNLLSRGIIEMREE